MSSNPIFQAHFPSQSHSSYPWCISLILLSSSFVSLSLIFSLISSSTSLSYHHQHYHRHNHNHHHNHHSHHDTIILYFLLIYVFVVSCFHSTPHCLVIPTTTFLLSLYTTSLLPLLSLSIKLSFLLSSSYLLLSPWQPCYVYCCHPHFNNVLHIASGVVVFIVVFLLLISSLINWIRLSDDGLDNSCRERNASVNCIDSL